MQMLGERLDTADGFFRGGRVVLDIGPRLLAKENFVQLSRFLAGHEMRLGIVRSDDARTIQVAINMGLATSTDETDPVQIVEVRPAPSAKNQPPYFVHRGNLRSGQVLRKAESVVVLGDVNPGAQVISAGDIIVWGRLRGVAHAGVDDNQECSDRGSAVCANAVADCHFYGDCTGAEEGITRLLVLEEGAGKPSRSGSCRRWADCGRTVG